MKKKWYGLFPEPTLQCRYIGMFESISEADEFILDLEEPVIWLLDEDAMNELKKSMS